jgi:hypothetical protein
MRLLALSTEFCTGRGVKASEAPRPMLLHRWASPRPVRPEHSCPQVPARGQGGFCPDTESVNPCTQQAASGVGTPALTRDSDGCRGRVRVSNELSYNYGAESATATGGPRKLRRSGSSIDDHLTCLGTKRSLPHGEIEQQSHAGPSAGPKPEPMTVPRGASRSNRRTHPSRLG